MSNKITQIRTPVGRLVQGSLYRGNTKDREGNVLVYKTGKMAGQPRMQFYFAVAIPKQHGLHWSQTEWGSVIYNVGHSAFPNIATPTSTKFAWKIADGDSTEPNSEGTRPCDCQGFAGCWVLRFSSSMAPKVCTARGEEYIAQEDFVNLGDFVQVAATVDGNDSTQQPGVYLNGMIVAFQGYGERIILGIDAKSVGFGQEALPAGCMPTPPSGMSATPAPSVTPPVVQGIPAPAATQPPPYPGIMTPAPAPIAPPPAPIAPPVPVSPLRMMTPAAQGHSYEAYKGMGWSDDDLIRMGYMVN